MKITHICLSGPVTDHWHYQDNLLPKYHKKIGYDVSLITSKFIYDTNGEIIMDDRDNYVNENGIKIIRLRIKKNKPFQYKFKRYHKLDKTLIEEKPDILFIHSVQFLDINTIIKYLKSHTRVKVYIDNHADFNNSATNWLSKNILHKIIWKHYANKIEPYTSMFYGVLPARVDFLIDVYKLPKNKVDLLVMGADDDYVHIAKDNEKIIELRKKYSVEENQYLLITGGKIDLAKTSTLTLMKAIHQLELNVKLIVFGPVVKELWNSFIKLVDNDCIIHIPWLNIEDSYYHFGASDLAVFLGRHSVYWEQTLGIGVPMLVKSWQGMDHMNISGNVYYINDVTEDEIVNKLHSILTKENLTLMRKAAKEASPHFLYSNIALKSLNYQNKFDNS